MAIRHLFVGAGTAESRCHLGTTPFAAARRGIVMAPGHPARPSTIATAGLLARGLRLCRLPGVTQWRSARDNR